MDSRENHDVSLDLDGWSQTTRSHILVPLTQACSEGDVNTLRELLLGDGIKAFDKNFVLTRAVASGHTDVVRFLVEESHADVNTLTQYGGKSVLMFLKAGDIKMAELLCQHGCDVNHVDVDGNTALMKVLKYCVLSRYSPVRNGPIIDLLLQQGADVNAKNSRDTPLLIAIDSLNYTMVEKLLNAGADVNLAVPVWRTPLRHTLRQIKGKRRSDICKLIVKTGPLRPEDIHFPITKGETEIVELMVDTGVLPGLRDVTILQREWRVCLPKYKSPFLVALLMMNERLIRKFLDTNFLHENDLHMSFDLRTGLVKYTNNFEYPQLFESIYSSPWSLWTLCFVKISTCVGLESDRRYRLSQTGLPRSLQDKLMFGVSAKE